MSGKLSGQIELLVDNIIMEKKQENAEVSLESVLSDLMCHQDMERKPKQVIRKIVEKILNDYYKKCKQIEIDQVEEEKKLQAVSDQERLMEKQYVLISKLKKKVKMEEEQKKEEQGQQGQLSEKEQQREEEKILEEKMIEKMSGLDELGGLSKEKIEELIQPIRHCLVHKDLYGELGVDCKKGILLTGPTGSGKTALGVAVGKEVRSWGCYFRYIQANSLIGGITGQSEQNLRGLFKELGENAPSLLFIDEVDSVGGKKESAQREQEKRLVSQLTSCFDQLASGVMVIGSTSKPDTLDTSLRRPGRFDQEYMLTVPNEQQRIDMFTIMTQKIALKEVHLDTLIKDTPGYVAADLKALITEAAVNSVQRAIDNDTPPQHIAIDMDDLQRGLKCVQPTGTREGFSPQGQLSFQDIGALEALKQELYQSILMPIMNIEKFKQFGINPSAGLLLYGPPGCGKTLLARAVAREAKANFISIKGPELLNKYVGESERGVRQLFQRARFAQPCVVFLDELDAVVPRRGGEGGHVTDRVVNQFLTEIDGVMGRGLVFLLAATNRPDMIDAAMLRPGRLDKLLYVPFPSAQERLRILQVCLQNVPGGPNLPLHLFLNTHPLAGFTGADLSALAKQAALFAILDHQDQVTIDNLEQALKKVKPSLSPDDQQHYIDMHTQMNENVKE